MDDFAPNGPGALGRAWDVLQRRCGSCEVTGLPETVRCLADLTGMDLPGYRAERPDGAGNAAPARESA